MPATDLQVQCIVKRERLDPHERIESVGGVSPRWHLSEEAALAAIKTGHVTLFTLVNSRRANVYVSRSARGREYLTTEPDGIRPNNPLSLMSCPLDFGAPSM